MTKADLIDEVSSALNVTPKESAVIVQFILDSMVKALRRGEKIEIRGFGSFHTRQRQPRTGRNPKTGQHVAVPAKTIPYFRPSKEVRALINNSAVSSKEPALA
jgi:integration host factor subunit beta